MKKIWYLVFTIALFAVVYYIVTHYLFYSISLRGIIPAIKLPGKDVKQYLPQQKVFQGPIRVESKLTMDVFADLDGDLPRALLVDNQNHLLVTATSRGKVLAVLDTDGNGKAEEIKTILKGLNKPHGMAFHDGKLYVAETDQVARYDYDSVLMTVGGEEVLFTLPGGGRHFTRTIRIHDGELYTSVGSSCDVCVETDWRRAGILVSNLDGTNLRTFAKGLRNTVFFVFDEDGQMWGTDMGRDNLSDDLPPDELNVITEGKDYGWPYCYGNRVRDSKFMTGSESTYCLGTEPPVYNFAAHTAPLGLAFIDSPLYPDDLQKDLIVAQHGSWNSSVEVGYRVVRLDFFADQISGETEFIGGLLKDGDVLGRPVDLVFNQQGELFISDDYAGVIYIINL